MNNGGYLDGLVAESCGGSFDLTIVGAGISGAFTLLKFLDNLDADASDEHLDIAVIEQSSQFFTGIPYGPPSGAASLIITPTDEFLTGDELTAFQAWIADNADWLLDDFRARGGERSQEWLARSEAAIAAGTVERIHVPRYFFGYYVRELLSAACARAEAAGSARVSLIHGEATCIERTVDGFRLDVGDNSLSTRLAVLALGMPPTRRIFNDVATQAFLVDSPYQPDIDTTMDQIADFAQTVEDDRLHAVIIGANAGSLEMLYLLDNDPRLRERDLTISVVAPQGRLPERFVAVARPGLVPTNLNELANVADISADDILKAVRLDIEAGVRSGLGISDRLPPISTAVGELIGRLDPAELQNFATFPGIEIGRIQRRAGEEYCDAADELTASGRMSIIQGWFSHLEPTADGAVTVGCRDESGESFTLDQPAKLVINCSGSVGLNRPNQSALIEALLGSGLCRANDSGQGFEVDDTFSASDGLFVHGPLLAGNVVQGSAIWHVEHAGRIIKFAPQVADQIHSALFD